MNLLQMSFTGGVLILAVIVLRAMALNRLPKGTFLALWAVAALRLLVPFSIPSPVSVYTLADSPSLHMADGAAAVPAAPPNFPAVSAAPAIPSMVSNAEIPAAPTGGEAVQIWFWVWLAGVLICGGFFLLSYLRCRREFNTALPVEDAELHAWLAGRGFRRTVDLCQSDRIHAPLTYGLLRPVILLPINWRNEPQLDYVLEHELAHIRYLDALWKPLLALTACVHWFNPLVWCMFVLANRDMELRCDEAVVRLLGLDSRSGYALTLISLEEKKSGLGPFASAFSKNAIEERIRAIMKIRKRSLAAIVAAVLLVCCITTGFATSAAKEKGIPETPAAESNVAYASKQAQSVIGIMDAMDELLPELTEEEKLWIANQYIAGYSDLTVTAYRQKVQMKWGHTGETNQEALDDYVELQSDTDHPAVTLSGFKGDSGSLPVSFGNWSALDRYIELRSGISHPADALSDFDEYLFNVFLPLMKDSWQAGHDFSGEASTSLGRLEYNYSISVTDPDTLTVGEYQRMQRSVEPGVQNALDGLTEKTSSGEEMTQDELDANMKALFDQLNSIEGVQAHMTANDYIYLTFDDPDAELHAQSSRETAAQWAELLSPYVPFGLTYQFDDPDLDGNGLTMWFRDKEVRGICDERKGLWITEHSGNSAYSDDAVELYTVYTDGVLIGLRLATLEEQTEWDTIRQTNHSVTIPRGTLYLPYEPREFPRATWEHYESLLALRTVEYTDLPPWASYPYPDARDLTLEDFNQRLLDWAHKNPIPWDYINCDVLWNDYGVELTTDERQFVAVTCLLSGTENGQMVRALYTGGPEEDPHLSASMPMRSNEENGIVNAWCDLYYDISYHIADKSAVTVRERDTVVGGMMNAINIFWQDTDLDTLLQMTEDDVVAQFNAWAAENSTENVKINPITADNIHFDPYDERGID